MVFSTARDSYSFRLASTQSRRRPLKFRGISQTNPCYSTPARLDLWESAIIPNIAASKYSAVVDWSLTRIASNIVTIAPIIAGPVLVL